MTSVLQQLTLAAIQELYEKVLLSDQKKDAEILELKTQLAAQAAEYRQSMAEHTKAMTLMVEAFSARMTALERPQGISTQTARLNPKR